MTLGQLGTADSRAHVTRDTLYLLISYNQLCICLPDLRVKLSLHVQAEDPTGIHNCSQVTWSHTRVEELTWTVGCVRITGPGIRR